ncbi:MAG: FixH family protein [Proteobacteria bacterium]|nr:FixH family protein [Pseudomonadota bacterium]
MQTTADANLAPWYRHRWPWFLMAGPGLVVVASFITLWLAIVSSDGLVTEEYYKKGLAINQTLALSDRAKLLRLEAGLRLTLSSVSVRLGAKEPGFVPPAKVRVTISHPTRAGLDQSQVLTLQNGLYNGPFRLPAAGHWLVLVEDEAKTWRVLGNVVLPAAGETVLGGGATAGPSTTETK